jgi:hypothetical protein
MGLGLGLTTRASSPCNDCGCDEGSVTSNVGKSDSDNRREVEALAGTRLALEERADGSCSLSAISFVSSRCTTSRIDLAACGLYRETLTNAKM